MSGISGRKAFCDPGASGRPSRKSSRESAGPPGSAQSDLARVLATLSPGLSWQRLDCLQGPVVGGLEGIVSNDTLVVAGSPGRDGWAARFRPNLAEELSRQWPTHVVIVKKPDSPALALLNGTTLQDRSDTDTTRGGSSDSHRKKRSGSY